MDSPSMASVMNSLFMAGFFTVILLLTVFGIATLISHVKEWMMKEKRPPIAGLMLHQLVYFNTLFDYQTFLARKYPTYRLILASHSDIYTSDPVNVEYILKTNFSNYSKGKYNYEIMKDLFGDGIFAVDGDKWRHQRKLASYEFSTKVLRDFSSDVFRSNAAKLVANVSEAASLNKMIDLQDMLMKSTLDSMFKVGFGIELNSLSGSNEFGNRFTKAFDDSNVIVFWRFVDPFWKIKRFLNIGLEASLKRNIKVMDDFVFNLIKHKREQMKSETKSERSKQDILSRFLIESEKDAAANMTDRYLRDIILNFMVAGKDTSANTLTWFFYMLCKNPFIQEKIVQEVRESTNTAGNDISNSIDEFTERITEEALDKMQYLHAALTETLRLYPAVPVDGKNSDEEDILPDGLKVRKGDGMNYMPYAMGRMTYIWGDDAEDFRPERWLQNGVFRPESPFKFTAFQAGPRICLGKEFAYRQMKIFAAILLNFFKFKLRDEKKEAKYRTMFTLHMDQGLHLFAFHRLKN
ncbi:Cytochrome P450 [Macleaya cordata]|uniref:Cytochrome P450 n=1 Tax=Macleaya cordata TaxID=56857 RepID=A0A200PMP3_MACCD|nr:Cytochrome P450 [Macleaya cordata]